MTHSSFLDLHKTTYFNRPLMTVDKFCHFKASDFTFTFTKSLSLSLNHFHYIRGAGARPPPVDECEKLRQELLGDPYQLSILRERDPQFAAAINDKDQFKKV